MLYWAAVFLVVALVAAILGFGGLAGASAGIAKILFVVFLVLYVISLTTRAPRSAIYPPARTTLRGALPEPKERQARLFPS